MSLGTTNNFLQITGAIKCRGEFCPAYLYSEEAASRIAAYRPDIKLLVCLRPPAEMIYSWYWYGRNAVVTSLPKSFEEMMENPFLRDLGCFARHLRPYLDRFPAKNILVVQFAAILRDPDRVRRGVYEFLGVAADFKPQLEAGKNPARAPRFPILQSGAQRLYAGISAIPGVDKFLKSPAIAKMLQDTYHLLNSKARKYEPLAPEGAPQMGSLLRRRSGRTLPHFAKPSGNRLRLFLPIGFVVCLGVCGLADGDRFARTKVLIDRCSQKLGAGRTFLARS